MQFGDMEKHLILCRCKKKETVGCFLLVLLSFLSPAVGEFRVSSLNTRISIISTQRGKRVVFQIKAHSKLQITSKFQK